MKLFKLVSHLNFLVKYTFLVKLAKQGKQE